MESMVLIPKAIFRGKFSSLLIVFSTENNLIQSNGISNLIQDGRILYLFGYSVVIDISTAY